MRVYMYDISYKVRYRLVLVNTRLMKKVCQEQCTHLVNFLVKPVKNAPGCFCIHYSLNNKTLYYTSDVFNRKLVITTLWGSRKNSQFPPL